MAHFMRRFDGETYALLRIMAGLLFLCHGTSKLFGFPAPVPDAPAFVIYLGGAIEFVGGSLVAIGFFTRWAAFLCSGMMASAYWMAHGTNHLVPLLNGGEPAVLYCFVFLFIAAHGAGMWSVDGARGGKTA
jgi:putative oxidoreductase